MDVQRELDFAISTAKVAGTMMLRYFRTNDLRTTWKEDNTPLTVADTKINNFVIEEVKKYFPDHGVYGEEASFGTDRKYIWVCDPIDGTIPFSVGIPVSTFSMSLVVDGEPVLGVVFDPFQDRLYSASKDNGAYVNGKQIHVSNRELAGSSMDYELLEGHKHGIAVSELRSELVKRQALPGTLFSLIIGTMMVASGEYCACIYAFVGPENVAAAKIIVEEAGGRVTDIEGNDQLYDRNVNGAVISNGVVHDELLEIIKPHIL
jgi:fructose-1,6-bisphosphatase/inositol monophosphatase family enzyme